MQPRQLMSLLHLQHCFKSVLHNWHYIILELNPPALQMLVVFVLVIERPRLP